jgi:hypothetical protein
MFVAAVDVEQPRDAATVGDDVFAAGRSRQLIHLADLKIPSSARSPTWSATAAALSQRPHGMSQFDCSGRTLRPERRHLRLGELAALGLFKRAVHSAEVA